MTLTLKNPDLLKEAALVGGAWLGVKDARSLDVSNPSTGGRVGCVPDLGPDQIRSAIDAASRALPAWAGLMASERGKILRAWYGLVIAHADDLAAIMTAEQGKPLAEARGEIIYAASFIDWFAAEGQRAYGESIPSNISGTRIVTMKQPVGVCAAITPWNFPAAMIARKMAPGLAAGCTMVAKPASETPFSALALAALAQEAGVPPGVLNIVTTSDAAAAGKIFCESPLVRKISFTGSTAVGKTLMAQGAEGLKRFSLELGGNAPFIVFEDADLDAAADGAVICKFRNAGQTCVCANRIYVHESVYEAFTAKLVARVRDLKVGNGAAPGTDIGPLISARAMDKVRAHIDNALSLGVQCAFGGAAMDRLGPLFFQPTVLTGAHAGMKIAREETFGPVAPLFSFKNEDEVIAQANDTPYGLAAYFYTRDASRAWRVAEALQSGMVAINTPMLSTAVAPFGGVKESGFGREGSRYGLDEYLDIKYTIWGI